MTFIKYSETVIGHPFGAKGLAQSDGNRLDNHGVRRRPTRSSSPTPTGANVAHRRSPLPSAYRAAGVRKARTGGIVPGATLATSVTLPVATGAAAGFYNIAV